MSNGGLFKVSRYSLFNIRNAHEIGYVDPKEEIFYEPHESRVDGDKYAIFGLKCVLHFRYQAVVPEFNTTNKTTQFFKEDANKQCVLMPMDVSYLHTSCVYDPAILSELDEKEVEIYQCSEYSG